MEYCIHAFSIRLYVLSIVSSIAENWNGRTLILAISFNKSHYWEQDVPQDAALMKSCFLCLCLKFQVSGLQFCSF